MRTGLKRMIDITLAVGLAVPALLIAVPAMGLIRMTSPGPALFRQIRVGQGQRTFTLYKLRTMDIDTGDRPSHHAASSQITPLGRWLRRTKLDELPQILNVLRGDMSFVGPRPCLPSQHALIEARTVRGIYLLRPGITGLAQVRGMDMSDPEKLAEIDGEYLGRANAAVDLALLWRTFAGSGSGDAIDAVRSSPTKAPS